VEEQEDPPEKPFDPAPLAQFLFGPGRGQAGTVLLPFRIPRNNSGSLQNGVNPGDEALSPIRCIKTDGAGADVVEMKLTQKSVPERSPSCVNFISTSLHSSTL
jgi:hypothetical protein